MTAGGEGDLQRVLGAVADVVEQVFGVVDDVHAGAGRWLAVDDPGLTTGAARRRFDETVQRLLTGPGRLVVGAGLIAAQSAERGQPVALRWWQVDPLGGPPSVLEPDLRPASLGYYDPEAAAWFDVPRRAGRRHVVGPYVDVHGTGQYLLTLTAPVLLAGRFVGVAGADLPVSRFETHLLSSLDTVDSPFVLLDDEGRVVVSTCPRWLVGDLVHRDLPTAGVPVPGAPWSLHVIPRTTLAS